MGDFFPRVALFPETEDLVRHPRDRFALTDFPIAAVLLGDRAEPSLIASTVVTVRAIRDDSENYASVTAADSAMTNALTRSSACRALALDD